MTHNNNGNHCDICEQPLPERALLVSDGNGGTVWRIGRYCNRCDRGKFLPGSWMTKVAAEQAMEEMR
jgi:hypothetical protein